jgi:hypothetical protein
MARIFVGPLYPTAVSGDSGGSGVGEAWVVVVEIRATITRNESNNMSVGANESRRERVGSPTELVPVLNTSASDR